MVCSFWTFTLSTSLKSCTDFSCLVIFLQFLLLYFLQLQLSVKSVVLQLLQFLFLQFVHCLQFIIIIIIIFANATVSTGGFTVL